MGGDPFQQRPVARAHRIPVDSVHVLTPVVVAHQPGVLVEHLPPLVARQQLPTQPVQVHCDAVLVLGPRIGRLHPQVVAVADHQLPAVPADRGVVAGVDHHGQFAFGDVVGLDAVLRLLARQLPGTEHTGVRSEASPQNPLGGGTEPVVAACRHGQRNHPVLCAIDVQDDVRFRFRGVLVQFLVLWSSGLADGPAVG